MTFLILLLVLAAALAVAAVRLALTDGRGPAGPPCSHDHPTFRSPTAW